MSGLLTHCRLQFFESYDFAHASNPAPKPSPSKGINHPLKRFEDLVPCNTMVHGRDDVRGDVVGVTSQRREHNGLAQLFRLAIEGSLLEIGNLNQVVLSLQPPRIGLGHDSMVPNGVAALGVHAVEAGLSPFAFQSDAAASRSHGQTPALFGRDVGCGDAAVHLERGARKVGRLVAGKK